MFSASRYDRCLPLLGNARLRCSGLGDSRENDLRPRGAGAAYRSVTSPQGYAMAIRFRFVHDHQAEFSVERLCALVEIARSSFDARSDRVASDA